MHEQYTAYNIVAVLAKAETHNKLYLLKAWQNSIVLLFIINYNYTGCNICDFENILYMHDHFSKWPAQLNFESWSFPG